MVINNTASHLIKKPNFGFLTLLLSLFSLQVIPTFFTPTGSAFSILLLLTVVLVSSLYLVVYNRTELLFGLVMAFPVLLLSWWDGLFSAVLQAVLTCMLYIIFLLFIGFHLLRYLFESSAVSRDMIYAGICLYLVVGLIWSFIYVAIEIYLPGSFSHSVKGELALASPQVMLGQFIYFSYVTLSTLGYGDITPITRLARSWATIEAIIGQFYLAVVVARLVASYTVSGNKVSGNKRQA
jgi:Ion channel